MPLNTEVLRNTLREKIKSALDAPITEKSDSDTVKRNLANSIADAIADGVDVWIKTATVTIPPGVAVSTSGSATSQVGATTAPGIGSIS